MDPVNDNPLAEYEQAWAEYRSLSEAAVRGEAKINAHKKVMAMEREAAKRGITLSEGKDISVSVRRI